ADEIQQSLQVVVHPVDEIAEPASDRDLGDNVFVEETHADTAVPAAVAASTGEYEASGDASLACCSTGSRPRALSSVTVAITPSSRPFSATTGNGISRCAASRNRSATAVSG